MNRIAFMFKALPDLTAVDKMPIPDVIDARLKDPEKIAARRVQFIEDRLLTAHRNPLTAHPVFAAMLSGAPGSKVAWASADNGCERLLESAAAWIRDAGSVVTADGTYSDLFLMRRLASVYVEEPEPWMEELRVALERPRFHTDIRLAWCGDHGSLDLGFLSESVLGVAPDPVTQDDVAAAWKSREFTALVAKAEKELEIILHLGARVCHLVS